MAALLPPRDPDDDNDLFKPSDMTLYREEMRTDLRKRIALDVRRGKSSFSYFRDTYLKPNAAVVDERMLRAFVEEALADFLIEFQETNPALTIIAHITEKRDLKDIAYEMLQECLTRDYKGQKRDVMECIKLINQLSNDEMVFSEHVGIKMKQALADEEQGKSDPNNIVGDMMLQANELMARFKKVGTAENKGEV